MQKLFITKYGNLRNLASFHENKFVLAASEAYFLSVYELGVVFLKWS